MIVNLDAEGSQIRDFLYVEDLVDLIEKILLTTKKIKYRIFKCWRWLSNSCKKSY